MEANLTPSKSLLLVIDEAMRLLSLLQGQSRLGYSIFTSRFAKSGGCI
ncbi:MAG: hypothetical protein ACYTXI_26625 [Nostoc sp.]